jgi:hypothetical protein
MGLAPGAKDVLRNAFPAGFVRAPPEMRPIEVWIRDMMLLMRGKPRAVTTGRAFFHHIKEIVQDALLGGAKTYVLVYDKPFVPRAKGVEQSERDKKNPPLPDDYPLVIGDGCVFARSSHAPRGCTRNARSRSRSRSRI